MRTQLFHFDSLILLLVISLTVRVHYLMLRKEGEPQDKILECDIATKWYRNPNADWALL